MNILFVTPRLCYPEAPYAGEKITYRLMKDLASRGHKIFLITGLLPGTKLHLKEIESFGTVLETIDVPMTQFDILKAAAIWLTKGFRGGLTIRKKAALAVARFTPKTHFDIIHVEHTALGQYIQKPDGIPMTIVAHDVLLKPALREYQSSKGIGKTINYVRFWMTRKNELSIYRRFDKIYTLSDFDRKILSGYNKNLNVSVLSPHVTLRDVTGGDASREPNSILFIGAMDRHVNGNAVRYFYKNIYPHIKKEIPDSSFYVVGNNPPEDIRKMAQTDNSVHITGFVEDVAPFYLKASVFIAPLSVGGGIIMKILDSMAAGLPVVTTTIGNEGIEAVPERDILIADSPIEFARQVALLLKDQIRWRSISENGRIFVRNKFSWDCTIHKVEDDFHKLAAGVTKAHHREKDCFKHEKHA